MATHNQVAHNWAHQTGKARKGFAMFYEGDTIYSWGYHFPMARHMTTPSGAAIILLTRDRYSVSTSKHLTITHRAIGYSNPAHILRIGRVLEVSEIPRGAFDADMARAEMDDILSKLPDIALRAKRARVRTAWHVSHYREEVARYNRINTLWRIRRKPLEVPATLDAMIAEAEAAEAKRAAEQDKRDRIAIRKWFAGEDVRPPHTRTPYVRVVSLPNYPAPRRVVQTSWGVTVPLRAALAAYRLAKCCAAKGKAFRPVKDHRFAGFRLDHITAEGTILAGCHVIPLEVSRMAAKAAGLEG